MKPFTLSVLLFLFANYAAAQQYTECGAIPEPFSIEMMSHTRAAVQAHTAQFVAGGAESSMPVDIPVQVHILRRSNGTGGLTAAEWDDAMANLNDYYAGADLNFFNCAPPNFIDDDVYFDFEAADDQAPLTAAEQIANVLNIYIPGGDLVGFSGGNLCGYAYFPWSSTDLVVTKYSCLTNGSTFVHEVGHYFGLYHTHGTSNCGSITDEFVNGSNCSTRGDDVCDTPADPNLLGVDCDAYLVDTDCNYTGTLTDVNGHLFTPDPTNIMSYSRKSCRTYLSPGQLARANFYATESRGYLTCGPVVVPSNDLCGGAIEVECNSMTAGNTFNATASTEVGACGTILTTAGGVWYRLTGTGEDIVVSICDAPYDSKLGIFSTSTVGCADLTCVAGVDDTDGCDLGSELTFLSEAGTTYYFYVTGYGTNQGTFSLNISCENNCTPPQAGFQNSLNGHQITLSNTASFADNYLWTFGNFSSSQLESPEPFYLPPGTHEICLTVSNACGQDDFCRTVVVANPAEGLTFDLAEAVCTQAGSSVTVPITVTNFTDILNFQFSVSLEQINAAHIIDATFVDLPGGPVSAVINDSTAAFVWDNNNGHSMNDGDVIAYLEVELSPASSGSSLLAFSDTPTPIYAEILGGFAVAPITLAGAVSVCETVAIRGNISREDGAGIALVEVQLFKDGLPVETFQTTASGAYSFTELERGASYVVRPAKDTDYLNGVNAGDLSRIQQHILSITPFDTPYKYIAGDVSMPNALNSGDLTRIRQLIFNDISAFANVDSWRFVAANHVFSDPQQPTASSFPEQIEFAELNEDVVAADFSAMKMGDVSNGADPESTTDDVTFILSSSGVPVTGETFSVDVKTVDFANIIAAQYSISWDSSKLEFLEVTDLDEELGISSFNFSFNHLSRGQLPWVWFDADPVSAPDSTVLFRLNFNVLAPAGDTLDICFTETPTSFYFESTLQELTGIFFKLNEPVVLPSALREITAAERFQLYPNPLSDRFWLKGAAGSADRLPERLSLYDSTGRLVKHWTGTNSLHGYRTGKLQAGVYFLHLQDSEGRVQIERLVIH